jgi:hypothetical protein
VDCLVTDQAPVTALTQLLNQYKIRLKWFEPPAGCQAARHVRKCSLYCHSIIFS